MHSQQFYEKKNQLLRRVEKGTATEAQKAWLVRRGFLKKPTPPPLKATYSTPTRTGPVYRYRRGRATPMGRWK